MATNFRVPFFKAQRDKLALDLLIDAKLAADKANKSRTISSFIENYDIIPFHFTQTRNTFIVPLGPLDV